MSNKHSRFGDFATSQHNIQNNTNSGNPPNLTQQPPIPNQMLHVPLHAGGGFVFDAIDPSDYNFYMMPVSSSTLSALNLAKHSGFAEDWRTGSVIEPNGEPEYVDAPTTMSPTVESGGLDSDASISGDSAKVADNPVTSAVRKSPSGHEVLLQNLVDTVAKFVPSRFSDPPSEQAIQDAPCPTRTEVDHLAVKDQVDSRTVRSCLYTLHVFPSLTTTAFIQSFPSEAPRERKADRKPRSLAQASLLAALNQPPPSAGTGCPPMDVFYSSQNRPENVRSNKVYPPPTPFSLTVSPPVKTQTTSAGAFGSPGTPTPMKVTPVQLQQIAKLHYDLACANSNVKVTPSRASAPLASSPASGSGSDSSFGNDSYMLHTPSPPGSCGAGSEGLSKYPPLDSWEDICNELRTLEVLRRDMMTMLSQSAVARAQQSQHPTQHGAPVACV